jgi:hypothetical protein
VISADLTDDKDLTDSANSLKINVLIDDRLHRKLSVHAA